MFKYLRIAARNIIKQKRRTLLLMNAIILVIIILIILLSISQGVMDTLITSSTTLLSGHVNISGFYKITSNNAAPMVTNYQELVTIANENIEGIDYIVDRTRGWGKLISESDSIQSMIMGVDIEKEKGFTTVLQAAPQEDYVPEGQTPSILESDFTQLSRQNTIILFAEQAKHLKVDVGDFITLSSPSWRGVNNTIDLEVVGVAKDIGIMSTFTVIVNKQDIRTLYTINDNTTGVIQIYLNDVNRVNEVEDKLRGLLAAKDYNLMDPDSLPFFQKFDQVSKEAWTGQKIDITTWDDEISFIEWIVTAIDSISIVFITILVIIIIAGIMNTLWMAIRERTKEIGTLRAIGMQRRSIMAMFMTEAFLISFMATLIGIVLGYLVSYYLNAASITLPKEFTLFLLSEQLKLKTPVLSLINILLIMTFIMTMGALYPSYRASKMKPITAIHHIG